MAHGLSRWRHGRCRRRPSLPLYLTAFPVTPGCFKHVKHFKTTRDISRFNTVDPGSPRLSTVPPRLRHDRQTGMNRSLSLSDTEHTAYMVGHPCKPYIQPNQPWPYPSYTPAIRVYP